jgi:nucleoside-diphosphate-sugar epimerase
VRLAESAAAAGVRRFLFLSSIGVNGSESGAHLFSEADVPAPTDPYAISKWEAEQALLDIAARTRLQIVRIRPPLVIGAQAKGNLLRLMRLVERGLPLPFGAIHNARSFVAVEDLCDLLWACCRAENVAGELFLAADPEELSTPQLMREIGAAFGSDPWLVPVPEPVLRFVARAAGLQPQINRLISSLRVDASKARRMLGWQPRVGLHAAIGSMARAYLRERRG